MKVIAVLPAYNEAAVISDVIARLNAFVDRVVVVDDGSSDSTGDLAKRAGAFVVRHLINRGQGAALETGTRLALDFGADVIIHFDADGQHDSKDIAAMKLAAIMDRGTKKDFIDIYFLIKKGISIEKAFKYYDQKYRLLANNLYSLIKGLSYFDDAEDSDMPEMITKVDWEEVKKFLQNEVIRLANKYI